VLPGVATRGARHLASSTIEPILRQAEKGTNEATRTLGDRRDVALIAYSVSAAPDFLASGLQLVPLRPERPLATGHILA
jgi:hypothetical protein